VFGFYDILKDLVLDELVGFVAAVHISVSCNVDFRFPRSPPACPKMRPAENSGKISIGTLVVGVACRGRRWRRKTKLASARPSHGFAGCEKESK
jgi:hypothetical protein